MKSKVNPSFHFFIFFFLFCLLRTLDYNTYNTNHNDTYMHIKLFFSYYFRFVHLFFFLYYAHLRITKHYHTLLIQYYPFEMHWSKDLAQRPSSLRLRYFPAYLKRCCYHPMQN
ncbi:hypothetical protein OQL93_157 [Saccharomyces cerevisiae synthetic construct]|nr:hypothetical protein OQL93_157 [Saccharomyces cerevisiae synthetic construct]